MDDNSISPAASNLKLTNKLPTTAHECSPPAYILLTFLCDNELTYVHTVQHFDYPMPNCPLELCPQLYTSYLEVKAKEWFEPAAIIIMFLVSRDLARVG